MSHPAEGLLRRSLDEPASMDDRQRTHVSSCERCRDELAAARADRDATAGLLGSALAPAPDRDAAWHRLSARLTGAPGPGAYPPVRPATRGRWPGLRRPVVAATTVAVLAIGTTAAAAAADWLPIFAPKQVTAVSFDIRDVSALPDLSAYGTATFPRPSEPQEVADAAAATRSTGIAVPTPDALPAGIDGSPSYSVLPGMTGRFTFSAERAKAAAERGRAPLPALPAGIDGSSLQVQTGPGVLTVWGESHGGVPELAVLRMTAPLATAQGVSLPTLRDYLLAQPGIPAATAAQLRALPDDGSVLPIPVPPQYATSTATTMDGVPATAVRLKDGSGAGIVWIKDGRLTAVLGLLDAEEIEDVARGLR